MSKQLRIINAEQVFDEEINTLKRVKTSLSQNDAFNNVEDAIRGCKGKVILCGMGKSGHIGRKISATFASLGIPSFFLHPGEAMHGDLGMVDAKDVLILISHSGESTEVVSILPSIKVIGAKTIALTGNEKSTLARECDVTFILDVPHEACALDLAPTSSTTATLVLGDALAVVASEERGFTKSDFGLRHPAGTLGKKVLTRVKHLMAKGKNIPFVFEGCSITEAIMEMSKKGLGVVAIVDEDKILKGLLTDGDLRRAIEKKIDLYNGIIDEVMTVNPKSITSDLLAVDALSRLKENHLNNYPVVDGKKRLVGMLTWQMIIREGITL
ncbi:KpsF/GutQ family sugar-phosphate isomerase [Pseudobutyrivibrio ruminis]|uniref:KpsF/GutQ family sugar-phosphate isomerase n=1 Tax=Pseudobutyrivibrio ruminis TaxID=46206 RepID=UPI00051C846D|nr:KpsF/GutQ family sugar-phosphate isomerase [Pseudobutyrivibrio ruminis]